ncbi:MAG: hypothetical protein PHD76_13950 [Methylacidiphilales bacterium]|nr:hypothetical protein [Candidatus Methylacidiphilales bacterium]
MRTLPLLFASVWLFICITTPASAQLPDKQRIANLEAHAAEMDNKAKDAGDAGLVLILFGAFCALWAQNTGRNAWLWFFLGLFFSVFTVVVLLVKNSNDHSDRQWKGRFTFTDKLE